MKCQNCGEREANVRYTQIINGVKKEMVLCEECSKKMGLDNFNFNMPINFSSFLGDFLEDTEGLFPSYMNERELRCPECGMTYQEFLDYGKFGCDRCPETFENKLNTILQNVQGTYQHSGKKYKELIEGEKLQDKKLENKVDEKQDKLRKLKQDQQKAIKEERYEDAAKIRDEIKKLEK